MRYDLWSSGLPSVLWADAGLYFCARSYRGYWLPRGTRHEGLAQGREMIDFRSNELSLISAPRRVCRAKTVGAIVNHDEIDAEDRQSGRQYV